MFSYPRREADNGVQGLLTGTVLLHLHIPHTTTDHPPRAGRFRDTIKTYTLPTCSCRCQWLPLIASRYSLATQSRIFTIPKVTMKDTTNIIRSKVGMEEETTPSRLKHTMTPMDDKAIHLTLKVDMEVKVTTPSIRILPQVRTTGSMTTIAPS